MYLAFSTCPLLVSIGDLSDWDTSKVNGTSASSGFVSMFNGAFSLKSVGDISDWSMAGISGDKNQMNTMFANCYSLSKINVKN